MFISHENKCVNMDNMDSIEVAYREMHKDYIIEIRKNNSIVLCIYSSGHMTFEEAKFVYENILVCLNGIYFDDKKGIYVKKSITTDVVSVDESAVDDIIKRYYEQIEKKKDTPDDSQ